LTFKENAEVFSFSDEFDKNNSNLSLANKEKIYKIIYDFVKKGV
jgi:hypothetical protein